MSAGTQARTQREFLPAALEAQESPPSPAGRWLLVLLLALLLLGIAWASFGEVDIVVTAPGRIVPIGQVKQVQAPGTGNVAAIYVGDGDRVQLGQALIQLDSTDADADQLRIRQQLDDVGLQTSWRRELAQWLVADDINTNPLVRPVTNARTDNAKALALYRYQRDEISAALGSLEKERDAAVAELAMARAESEKVEATLAVLTERLNAHKVLLDKQYGARVQYLELLQAQTGLARSLPVLAARQRQLEATTAALTARAVSTLGGHRKNNLMELVRLESEQASLQQELRKTGQRSRLQLIPAPVTGTVQELAVHTVGAVLTPAQYLMKIVPEDTAIEVEAMLPNKDIGFVNEGDPAQVKIDTFNFTKFGLIAAELVDISNDAIEDPQLGWVFKIRLKLKQEHISVEGKMVKLSPGMAITAEIRTGKRRLIEFFLSPLLRYQQESARER